MKKKKRGRPPKKKGGRPRKKKFSKFQKKYKGRDVRRGRPIKLNKRKLKAKNGKAELLFFGDLHWGHPQCDKGRAIDMLEWAENTNTPVLLMGDLLESSTRTSVGTGVYDQEINPQKQMEEVIELLQPLADKNLIIGLHTGNHEQRIKQMTSIDVSMLIANMLDVPYLAYAGWTQVQVGKQKYTIYSTHGSGGSRFKHTKLKKVVDMASFINADIIASGHMHSLVAEPILSQEVYYNKVREVKTYAVITGSYLMWDKSYAQMKNMPPGKLGSPKCIFSAKEHDFYFSL